jgi:hypothetical protein
MAVNIDYQKKEKEKGNEYFTVKLNYDKQQRTYSLNNGYPDFLVSKS